MGNSALPDGIAFTCVCDEPEGKVLRTVREFEFSQENLIKLYYQVSKFPTFMGIEIRNINDMLRFFIIEDTQGKIVPKGLCLVIDDFIGVFWLTDIKGLHEASVHYTFFDRRHKGRVDLCKQALTYCFNRFKFHRLWTQVPFTATKVLGFVESLGFIKVGRTRRSTFYKGKFYDTIIYDLLADEFLPKEE